jgi:mediator of RNA polymerase II transcription subunit 12
MNLQGAVTISIEFLFSFSLFFDTVSFIAHAHRAIASSIGGTSGTMETAAGLSDFAQHVLRQICSQEWVLERCLQNPEELCHTDMLLDSMLTPKQVR